MSAAGVKLGEIREVWLKPLVYGLGAALLLLLAGLVRGRRLLARLGMRPGQRRWRTQPTRP
jgi:hypothetical protein